MAIKKVEKLLRGYDVLDAALNSECYICCEHNFNDEIAYPICQNCSVRKMQNVLSEVMANVNNKKS